MNASGNQIAGALAVAGVAARSRVGLSAADMGNETSISLFLGKAGETAIFQMRKKVNGSAIRPRPEARAFGQTGKRFQNANHRLRRFEMARVDFDDFPGDRSIATARRGARPAGGLRSSGEVAAKNHFPIAIWCLARFMAKAFARGEVKQRHRLKGNEQSERLAVADAVERILYFVARMLAGAKIGADVEGIDFRIHNSCFLSGLERVKSMENCLVAFTACGRFGGM